MLQTGQSKQGWALSTASGNAEVIGELRENSVGAVVLVESSLRAWEVDRQ